MIDKCIQYILQSINGLEVENPKVDFKKRWYDLKTKKGINEFLKDATSIANTVGLEGFMIIGYDEKSRIIEGTSFKDCGLKDESDLQFLIVKHCSHLFDINYRELEYQEKIIGILNIPPTLEKPIFIKNYQTFDKDGNIKKEIEQRVFVRKGTATFPANKTDFDLMYYDRKNIQPEYSYDFTITGINIHKNDGKRSTVNDKLLFYLCDLKYVLENLGRRAISIQHYILTCRKAELEVKFHYFIEMSNKQGLYGPYEFVAHVCRSGEVITKVIRFEASSINSNLSVEYFDEFELEIILSNGKSKVIKFENVS
jgi:hypothetical protein